MDPLILCAIAVSIWTRPSDDFGPLRMERFEHLDRVTTRYYRGDHLILRVSDVKIEGKESFHQEAYYGHFDEMAFKFGWKKGDYRDCEITLLGLVELIDFDLDSEFDLLVIKAERKVTVPREYFYLGADWRLIPVESEILNEAVRLKRIRDEDQDDALYPMGLEDIAAGLIARKRGVVPGSSYSIEDMKQWLDR